LVALLMALMLFLSAGAAIGLPSIEGLFLARVGPQALPYMYIALGLVTAITTLGITALLGRIPRVRFYLVLPPVLALLLVGARLLVGLDQRFIYGVLWVGGFLMETLQVTLMWGLAGTLCDTRQAKRLFPLFGAGIIIGTAAGGLITRPIAPLLGSENLLLLWALLLLVVLWLVWMLTRDLAKGRRRTPRTRSRVIDDLQVGFRYVRRSSLMGWIAISAVLFSFIFFILAFPFSKALAEQMPSEDAMTGFLGLFRGTTTALALLISVFLANRFYARCGLVGGVLSVALLLLAGFLLLAGYAAFSAIVAVRFLQESWVGGVARTAWQALFNVVPPQRREQARMFVTGVAWQAGIVLVGLVLVVAEALVGGRALFLIGALGAGLATYVMWRARRAYIGALADALRAGRPTLFSPEVDPLNVLRGDSEAVAIATAGLEDVDAAVRRLAVEMLADMGTPDTTRALVGALDDEDSEVRVALLRSLARVGAASAILDVAACLDDPEPTVRSQAVATLNQLAGFPQGLAAHLEPLLADPAPPVRAQAAAALLSNGIREPASAVLERMALDQDPEMRVQALHGFAAWGKGAAFETAVTALTDPNRQVRRAAAATLAQIQAPSCVEPLIAALGDEDALVREAVAVAVGALGPQALRPAVEALNEPDLEAGALLALSFLPVHQAAQAIHDYAQRRVTTALHYHGLWQKASFSIPQDERADLLTASLWSVAERHGVRALRAVGLLDEGESVALAIDNLGSPDPDQRANAMEILDSIQGRESIHPLLALWEGASEVTAPAVASANEWLMELLRDPDPWLRACAALVAQVPNDAAAETLCDELARLARADPDPIVREAAQLAKGESFMQTMPTLSMMERIMFLRRVPLFSALPPAELKQVAAVAEEFFFVGGEIISHQDDPGDALYIIVSGEIAVVSDLGGQTQTELARRQVGDYVGEMAIISHEPRMASLVAVGDVRTLCINRTQFEGILRERPETSLAVMRVLCARLREREGVSHPSDQRM
jgi:HEAT repeat protein